MRLDVITLFPDFVNTLTQQGVIGKAAEKGILQLHCWNPRDFTEDKHQTVDDRPYGGGPGMVMQFAPLQQAIEAAKQANANAKCIYLSPQGQPLTQALLKQHAQAAEETKDNGLILIAGRYEGIDQRIIDTYVDAEWSLGDYVISGGELAAMVVIDAITRLQDGALGHDESSEQDSFAGEQGLLDCPHYTRPEAVRVHDKNLKVPEVLLSGNHQAIAEWRQQQMLGNTWLKRPELLKQTALTERDHLLLNDFIKQHNNNNKT